jgi:hypothetical protein
MNYMAEIDLPSGHYPLAVVPCYRAVKALEGGQILFLPRYGFPVSSSYQPLFSPAILSQDSKNVSYNPATGKIGGTSISGSTLSVLREWGVLPISPKKS